MDKKKREFWEAINNCCGAKIKYETFDNGVKRHSCRACGKVLWQSNIEWIKLQPRWSLVSANE